MMNDLRDVLLIEKAAHLAKLKKYPKVFPLMIKKLEREIKELKK